jgi:hypothetical protein
MVKALIARSRLNGTGDLLTWHVPSGQLRNMPLATILELAGWPSGPCTALGPAYRGPFVHLPDVPRPSCLLTARDRREPAELVVDPGLQALPHGDLRLT